MNIDWDKEPKAVGALVAKISNIHYPSITLVSEFHTFGCMFRGTSCEGHALSASNYCWDWIPRPVPAWSGDGFPPVGSMVMIDRMGLTIWPDAEQFIGPDVKVLANYKAGDEDMIVVESPDERSNCCFRACMARPIRTPEQIAAEEREAGIQSILDDYTYTEGPCTHKLTTGQATRIYDAGYRKEVKS